MIHLNQVLRLSLCITCLFSIVFIVVCCMHYRRLRQVRAFFAYGLLLLAAAAGSIYIYRKPPSADYGLIPLNIFLVAEFILCMAFMRRFAHTDEVTRVLLFLQQLFPLVFVYCWMYSNNLSVPDPLMFKLHHVLLCLACLLLFREFFIQPENMEALRSPQLLAVSGILCYSLLCFVFSPPFFNYDPGPAYHVLQLKLIAGSILFTWLFIAAFYELGHS